MLATAELVTFVYVCRAYDIILNLVKCWAGRSITISAQALQGQ